MPFPNGSSYSARGSSSSHSYQQPSHASASSPLTTSPNFDILDWHPAYQSCQKYFLDHAQHEPGTQALCALVNIRLPFQWLQSPIYSSTQSSQQPSPNPSSSYSFHGHSTPSWQRPSPSPTQRSHSTAPVFVSLVPYVRRLVITGFDKPGILHGFFGDAWSAGITPLQDCERRNYLFAAKHGGWRTCKKQYDLSPEETVPFLKPLQNVRQEELESAEKSWSSWLAMEDWMIGPRAPPDTEEAGEGGSEMRDYGGRTRGGEGLGMHGGMGFPAGLPDGVPDQLRD
ncbi:hypothetical protein H2203_000303 [Taxawa tesnikishii (nom. ined.)]|nr:hypothetical protein H2203_000303 [Dothideales sp. JES 119]